jgi:hypothetical protein
MFDHPLSLAVRASVTLTALVFVIVIYRAVFRRLPGPWALVLGGAFLVAAAFSHIGPLTELTPRLFRSASCSRSARRSCRCSRPARGARSMR